MGLTISYIRGFTMFHMVCRSKIGVSHGLSIKKLGYVACEWIVFGKIYRSPTPQGAHQLSSTQVDSTKFMDLNSA